MYDIVSVRHVRQRILEVVFENGEKGTVDLGGYAKKGGVFKKFADIDYFKRAHVNEDIGTICWPEGVDIAPETLYKLAIRKDAKKGVAI